MMVPVFIVLIKHMIEFIQDSSFIQLFPVFGIETCAFAIASQMKNSLSVTTTNEDGSFRIKTSASLPLTIQVSSLGYATQEFVITNRNGPISLSLNVQNAYASLVVVTASRVPENILKSPVSIEKLSLSAIKEAAAPSFYDALENLKGVQLTTSSITFKVPNTRGFNIPNNFRFVQLVDWPYSGY